jgi:hypothetical protein
LLKAQDTEQMSSIEMLARNFENFTAQPFRLDQITRVLKRNGPSKSLRDARSFQARSSPSCVHDAPQTSATKTG